MRAEEGEGDDTELDGVVDKVELAVVDDEEEPTGGIADDEEVGIDSVDGFDVDGLDEAPPASRYQLAGGSLRHSPTVTGV
jgi:hypothetical protein